ncbi:MAG: NfeD family protein [Clostridia bacterium]|nr:NfeD family protein [Clostridia bacterium]
MNAYTVFWLVLTVVFGVVEASTANLTTIWMAVAALAAAIVSAVSDISATFQLLIFAIISALLVLVTRPLAKKLTSKNIPTNADRIIDEKGIVIKTISSIENSGQIKVLGQIWSAKSDSDEEIHQGETVVVKGLEGVFAVVEKVEELQKV